MLTTPWSVAVSNQTWYVPR